jgi:hypothetical protein
VIFDAGTNDLTPVNKYWPYRDDQVDLSRGCAARNILYRSHLFWTCRKALVPLLRRVKNPTRRLPQDYRETCRAVKELAAEKGFSVVFLSQMRRIGSGALQDALEGWYCEPLVDVYGFFKEREKDIDLYLIDNVHGTPRGHELIAGLLYDHLIREGSVR